jgi:hypothetical protein
LIFKGAVAFGFEGFRNCDRVTFEGFFSDKYDFADYAIAFDLKDFVRCDRALAF